MEETSCIFCQIINGRAPAQVVWEDKQHLAFLSIFPNTEGFTVVATKKHYPSDAFDLPDDVLIKLILASKMVAKLINVAFDDVGRTGLILEGFGVNHLHSKLFPMHGTKGKWRKISSDSYINKFFEKYEGYISSHDSKRAEDEYLNKIASKIRSAKV